MPSYSGDLKNCEKGPAQGGLAIADLRKVAQQMGIDTTGLLKKDICIKVIALASSAPARSSAPPVSAPLVPKAKANKSPRAPKSPSGKAKSPVTNNDAEKWRQRMVEESRTKKPEELLVEAMTTHNMPMLRALYSIGGKAYMQKALDLFYAYLFGASSYDRSNSDTVLAFLLDHGGIGTAKLDLFLLPFEKQNSNLTKIPEEQQRKIALLLIQHGAYPYVYMVITNAAQLEKVLALPGKIFDKDSLGGVLEKVVKKSGDRENIRKMVKLLLQAGADVHFNSDGAVMSAVTKDDYPLVEILLDAGAKPTAALNRAITRKDVTMMKKIIEHYPKKSPQFTQEYLNGLLWALPRDFPMEGLRLLLALGVDPKAENGLALVIALEINDLVTARELVANGAEINKVLEPARLQHVLSTVKEPTIRYLFTAGIPLSTLTSFREKRDGPMRNPEYVAFVESYMKVPRIYARRRLLSTAASQSVTAWQQLCAHLSRTQGLKELQALARSIGMEPQGLSKRALCAALAQDYEASKAAGGRYQHNCRNEESPILEEDYNLLPPSQLLRTEDGYCFSLAEVEGLGGTNPYDRKKFTEAFLQEYQDKKKLTAASSKPKGPSLHEVSVMRYRDPQQAGRQELHQLLLQIADKYSYLPVERLTTLKVEKIRELTQYLREIEYPVNPRGHDAQSLLISLLQQAMKHEPDYAHLGSTLEAFLRDEDSGVRLPPP